MLDRTKNAIEFLKDICKDLNMPCKTRFKRGNSNFEIKYKNTKIFIEIKAYNKRRYFSDTGIDFKERLIYEKLNAILIFFDQNQIYGNSFKELIKVRTINKIKYPKIEQSKTGLKMYFPFPDAFIILSELNNKTEFKNNLVKLLEKHLENNLRTYKVTGEVEAIEFDLKEYPNLRLNLK